MTLQAAPYWPAGTSTLPTGQWWTPSQFAADTGAAANAVRTAAGAGVSHPVTFVRLTVPVGTVDTVPIVEQWIAPVTGGSVLMDADTYPRSSATIDVPADTSGWINADTGAPGVPTASSQGVPWAVLPYGTVAQVFIGYAMPTGPPAGIRLFTGPVMSSELTRGPGSATWTLTCQDLSAMIDGMAYPDANSKVVTELVVYPTEQVAPTEFTLRQVIEACCRETSERWWPMLNAPLEFPSAGFFTLDGAETGILSSEKVDAVQPIGGRSLWSLIEDWCDASGIEAYEDPGSLGRLIFRQSPTITTAAVTAAVSVGATGNVLTYTSGYARVNNRTSLVFYRDVIGAGDTSSFQEVLGWDYELGFASPTGVRRCGRRVYTEKRRIAASYVGMTDADERTERLARRVRGYARTNQLTIVPLPWIQPGDAVTVTLADGIVSEKHLVRSVTVPLAPGAQGMTLDTVNDHVT